MARRIAAVFYYSTGGKQTAVQTPKNLPRLCGRFQGEKWLYH
ncbi:hypothetical protein CHK_1658 [Christensenella hongkongensis]|uniref:Uncharacterized protein n=1 Tax=Christensenella hongkongensis TaxID=270498 RepID=A0A0M2NK91_9FIRM|nr:hypothetical protein CHK_1658 [Christensenella hongkongensis]